MDKKPYSLAEVLDPSRITRLSFPCEPATEELETFMNMGDGKTLGAYLKELDELIHAHSKDEDNAMTFTFILDSLGPQMKKNNVNMESK